jgi:hypothetical protein
VHTDIVERARVQPQPAVERSRPGFFRGLLVAFPLTTAIWVGVLLTLRADL